MTVQQLSLIFLATLSACMAGCDGTSATSPRPQPAAPVEAQAETTPRLQFAVSYREASEQALRDGRPLLLFFTASWCQHCQRMGREALRAPSVAELSQRFVRHQHAPSPEAHHQRQVQPACCGPAESDESRRLTGPSAHSSPALAD